MKNGLLLMFCLLIFSTTTRADIVAGCQEQPASKECQFYLEGIVDGALMYKSTAMGARLDTADGYESRALKYRGGKRYQEANITYCGQRIPNRDTLVSGLTEAMASGVISDIPTLEQAVSSMLDCQRLN